MMGEILVFKGRVEDGKLIIPQEVVVNLELRDGDEITLKILSVKKKDWFKPGE